MTAPRDKFGRPIVVVTGMGVVTSLGAGKTDNWAKLTAGESGIRTITRFPIDGLKTTMAGTVDFVPVEPFSSTGLTERLADMATEEAIAQSGIGSKGDFPGPLFLAVAPVEVEWPQRDGTRARRRQARTSTTTTCCASAAAASSRPTIIASMFGSVADHLAETFGTKGSPISLSTACASGATAIQLGVEAIRRGETDAALCVAHRRLGQSGSAGALLAAVGAVDPERSAAGRLQAVLEEPRRLRHGRRRRRAGAGKLRSRDRARRADPRRRGRLRRTDQFLSPHPLEPGRQADHRLRAARRWPTPA